MIFLSLLFIIAYLFSVESDFTQGRPQKHLIVLVHGLMGSSRDLEYLAQKLEKNGAVVLQSSANAYAQSLAGVKEGAEKLVEEIHSICLENPQLDRVSFVGNSLGGLFARYAIKLLSLPVEEMNNGDRDADFYLTTETGIDLGIKLYPNKFMTIASPYLGVLDHNYLQDVIQRYTGSDSFWFPDWMKKAVAKTMLRSGKELFLQDDHAKGNHQNSLVYRMCTEERWLWPLRKFKQRRLYANLDADFVVPLSTAAFLERHEVKALRMQHIYDREKADEEENQKQQKQKNSGVGRIVHEIVSSAQEDGTVVHTWRNVDRNTKTGAMGEATISTSLENTCEATPEGAYSPREGLYCTMRERLNSLGWEKYIVHFDSAIASNHNKLAAVRRNPEWFFNGLLGFHAGDPIMDHACEYLLSGDHDHDEVMSSVESASGSVARGEQAL